MRLGLIGTGRIGRLHARTLQRVAEVTEVLVADAAPERARELAAELGLSAVDQVADLYRDGVDGVVIAAATWRPPVLLAFLAAPLAFVPIKAIMRGASGRDLIGVLGATGRLQLAYALLASIGLLVGS